MILGYGAGGVGQQFFTILANVGTSRGRGVGEPSNHPKSGANRSQRIPHLPLWACRGRFRISGWQTTFTPSGGCGHVSGGGGTRRRIPPLVRRRLSVAKPRRGALARRFRSARFGCARSALACSPSDSLAPALFAPNALAIHPRRSFVPGRVRPPARADFFRARQARICQDFQRESAGAEIKGEHVGYELRLIQAAPIAAGSRGRANLAMHGARQRHASSS